MAGSLGLPEGSVEEFLGCGPESQALARLRVNHFPVCAQPELTWGIHGHRDPSVLTLLHQDDVGGLQIGFKDGTWHGVRPIPGAFVVNVGDLGQVRQYDEFLALLLFFPVLCQFSGPFALVPETSASNN